MELFLWCGSGSHGMVRNYTHTEISLHVHSCRPVRNEHKKEKFCLISNLLKNVKTLIFVQWSLKFSVMSASCDMKILVLEVSTYHLIEPVRLTV